MKILGMALGCVCFFVGIAVMGELAWPRVRDALQLVAGLAFIGAGFRLFERFGPDDDEDEFDD